MAPAAAASDDEAASGDEDEDEDDDEDDDGKAAEGVFDDAADQELIAKTLARQAKRGQARPPKSKFTSTSTSS